MRHAMTPGLRPARRCRRAITLRKIYGWSQKEIAVEMSLSENTVEKHIAKGLGLLSGRAETNLRSDVPECSE
jgi:DNA-directed RNA polymerase specialized sigma24 family protein